MLGRILIGVVRGYQLLISSWTPPTCRFAPSCSSYAIEAIQAHGAFKGAWLAARRIARCHPWGGHGYDPVPLRNSHRLTRAAGDMGPNDEASKVRATLTASR